MRFHGSALFVLGCCSLASACGGDKPATTAAPSTPIVGVLELPISLRVSAAAPADAADVEVSPSEVHVGGLPVMKLTAGLVAAADRQGTELPKLAAALKTPLRSRLALSIAAQVPYETLALVLSTAKVAGLRGVALKVRAQGSGTNTGYIAIDEFVVQRRSKTEDEVTFQSISPHHWSDFVAQWDEVRSACRASRSGSCADKPEKVAEGGNLKIVLHAAGQGVNVDFFQVGAPLAPEAPKRKAKVQLIEGVKGPTDLVKELEEAPPATEASFQFRAQEAVTAPSAVSATLKPVCGTRACGVVVRSEKATLFVRVASLLGAAFPDGTPAPAVAWELP